MRRVWPTFGSSTRNQTCRCVFWKFFCHASEDEQGLFRVTVVALATCWSPERCRREPAPEATSFAAFASPFPLAASFSFAIALWARTPWRRARLARAFEFAVAFSKAVLLCFTLIVRVLIIVVFTTSHRAVVVPVKFGSAVGTLITFAFIAFS